MTHKIVKKSIILISIIFLFSACSSKNEQQEYNKPALYWYNKMIKQIASGELDDADDTYTSLESEHRNSPLLASSLMIIANAHIDEEEYALANFYLDEYIKKFALSKNIDYVRFLKIKSKFSAFTKENRDQKLVLDTIADIDNFLVSFPKSPYKYLVETMKTRLTMSKVSLDKDISELYERIEKPKAAKFYDEKVKKSWINKDEIEPVKVPWYQSIFE